VQRDEKCSKQEAAGVLKPQKGGRLLLVKAPGQRNVSQRGARQLEADFHGQPEKLPQEGIGRALGKLAEGVNFHCWWARA